MHRWKMTRTPFPKKSNRETELLKLIHTDICGPMRVQSNGQSKYMITFIYDYSRWCEVRFLKGNDEAIKAFKEFKTMAENQTGKTIKVLQSDNGTEYINGKFYLFLRECGIERRLTVLYNPEQNGVAERKNRTLVEVARCMLIEFDLTSSFSAEAILTANYVRKRCPTSSLNGRTPYEKWHRQIPDISHLREFGSRAYALDRNPTRGKFDARSRKCIFLGYSEQSKGYRVWISAERKIEISRDVKFLKMSEPNTKKYKTFDEKDSFVDMMKKTTKGEMWTAQREVEIDVNSIRHTNQDGNDVYEEPYDDSNDYRVPSRPKE